MELLAGLFGLLALLAVPFVLALVALKVLLSLVLLPFKILAGVLKGVFGLVFGLLGGLFGLVAGGVSLLGVLLVLFFVVVLLPLAPLLLLGALVWLALKAFSPAPRLVA
jgi:hypothetical protein